MPSSGLVFGAIAPHGSMAIPGAVASAEDRLARVTQAAMEELGRRFADARPDSVVLVTPHNVHVEGAFAVVTAGRTAGELSDWGAPGVSLNAAVDRPLANLVRAEIRAAGLPVVGVSFGGNAEEEAVHPMDWAVLIPLWFMGGRSDPPVPVVVLSPARDLAPRAHVEAGRAVARAAAASGRRVALVASADHGHGHLASGPYGFRAESETYDSRIVDLLRRDRLAELVEIEPELVQAAAADSWWQMLVLTGALGRGWKGELLSYEHPTYFGMVCAAYVPG